MRRYKLTFQYDGTEFFGWQRQNDSQPSVQSAVEVAIEDLVGHRVSVQSAGRTDRGVHARAMPAHVDIDTRLEEYELKRAIDVRLPDGIAITDVAGVSDSFHARHQSVGKCYAYRILNSRSKSPLRERDCHQEFRPLDAGTIRGAAQVLVGKHDFSAFATLLSEFEGKLTTQPDPDNPEKPVGNIREVYALHLAQSGPLLTLFCFGSGFLRGMVRGIAGTLIDVGLGKVSKDDLFAILQSRDRREAGANAPAKGLTLEGVFYEESLLQEWIKKSARSDGWGRDQAQCDHDFPMEFYR